MTDQVALAVALDGYGWHRQAWRKTLAADPAAGSVLSGRYWAQLAITAERGLLDFLTIDDALTPQSGRRAQLSPGRLVGRADAVMMAAGVAPATTHIGLIPVATVTHTEPFHVAKAIATLDSVSHGRAGWQPRVSATAHEAALIGRRDWPERRDLFDEAADFVTVVRSLWDSRDGDNVHDIDFRGDFFSVKGPSVTPRPPQGQPVIAALAHAPRIYQFACATADLVFVTPRDDEDLLAVLAEVTAAGDTVLLVYADVVVTFGGDTDFGSDAVIVDGSPAQVADLVLRWHDLGVAGVRLRPAIHATDLPTIVDEVVPLLQKSGRFRTGYRDGETLRARLGLSVAFNRYVHNRTEKAAQ
jgi:alkanesulfonate monooxygenase SsuD/methylene tetrahydromethanopterin reductase-like flavin-dependent oxidoreductase (luciferase family)